MEKRGGGSTVSISAVAGVRGTANISAYIPSKPAVVGLMRSAALESAKKGIRVNTVNPAPIETHMMHSLEEGFSPDASAQAKEGFATMLPMHRYGEP